MVNWIINETNEEGIPSIMKIVHIGDFIELIYDSGNERTHGGYITLLTSDGPKADEGKEKVYVLGISSTHPNHNVEQEVIWADKIKRFRIIHKGVVEINN
tara:strand:+ start:96 stop:395 length:300 start_codon:yes stop_codon:yes gene_type:complete